MAHSFGEKAVKAGITFYREGIAPLISPGMSCRFYPTCSEYSVEAVKKYGFMRGVAKSAKRVLRCTPLSKGGVDLP